MRYWLMKSEPDDVSFDDVLAAPRQTVAWYGVRNYQAENMCPYKNGQRKLPFSKGSLLEGRCPFFDGVKMDRKSAFPPRQLP